MINYAKSRGMHVVYFPYDTTRAREEDLVQLLTRLMQEAPPDSVGVVDTMGCILPEAMKYHGPHGEEADQQSSRGGAHAQ